MLEGEGRFFISTYNPRDCDGPSVDRESEVKHSVPPRLAPHEDDPWVDYLVVMVKVHIHTAAKASLNV